MEEAVDALGRSACIISIFPCHSIGRCFWCRFLRLRHTSSLTEQSSPSTSTTSSLSSSYLWCCVPPTCDCT